jgi:hypothetical protein
MSPLVEKLWTQAAAATARLPSGHNNSWETEVNFIETFAKLVATECADIALTFNNNLQTLSDREIRTHSGRVSDCIKERFGVEDE